MENLLEIIEQGQSAALPELAKRLHISEELLLAKLERYEQLGYVKRVVVAPDQCGGKCKKCRGCSGMNQCEPFVYWEKSRI